MAEMLFTDVVEQARARLSSSRIYVLRQLEVLSDGDAIVLRGNVDSYYHKQLAQTIRGEVAQAAQEVARAAGRPPGLAAVLVGDNPASQRYVRNKRRDCEKAGLASWLHELPRDTTQATLLALLAKLNADAEVDGILVQLPLPPQIDESGPGRGGRDERRRVAHRGDALVADGHRLGDA